MNDPATPGLDDPALDQLFGRVYDELRRLAHVVRGGRAGDTLNTTALVHEAYLKLASAKVLEVKSRPHFFALAARAMRQILVDAARRHLAQKRGGDAPLAITLDESIFHDPLRPSQLVALDDALARLDAIDPRRARVVEHRIFAGLTADETAALLGVSRPTVERDWRAARAWLAVELEEAGP
ncbi:MAG: ECF-type sigma factor [Gemmatimonadales bacterium]